MPRTAEQIIAELDSLSDADFDLNNADARGEEQLQETCDESAEHDYRECAPAMFRVMERLVDADLGSPGPLVHTLERWRGPFEPLLYESVRRMPSPLSLWMVNRIINARPADVDQWMALLREAADHPDASPSTRAEAMEFLQFQMSDQA